MTLCRGTAEGALCGECPFSREGGPRQPVYSEFPEKPTWAVVGEGPGHFEVALGRPFMGPSGQVVNDLLARAGQKRSELLITNATLCRPTPGSSDDDRHRAAIACNTRLKLELSQFPGIPIFTLGAVAAKAVIPQAALDAIDPPETIKKRRAQKKNKAALEELDRMKRAEKLDKKVAKYLHQKLVYRRKQLVAEIKSMGSRARPDYLERRLLEDYDVIEAKAKADAETELAEQEAKKLERRKHPKKKPIKITDIISTLFEVDVDGTGARAVIPGIHPAALLRGGGKSIAGTHTPDLAFINLIADAAKVRAIAQGKDVRLRLNIETEFSDSDRASRLTREVLHEAFEDGAVACDLETYVDDIDRHTALQAYMARIRAIGFATKRRSVSVLWHLLDPITVAMFQLALASPRVKFIFHNALYDRTVLAANGLYCSPEFDDTLLAHHAAFPGNAHNLQQVTAQFFATTPWKSEYRNTEETPEGLTLYNAKDTGSTQALMAPLTVWIKRTQTEKVYALDKKMSRISSQMHLDGVPMSREANKRLLDGYTLTVAEARRTVEKIAEDPDTKQQIWHHLAFEQARKQRKKDSPSFEERYHARLEELSILDGKGKWRWKISASKHIASLLRAKGVMLVQQTAGGDTSTKKEILESLGHIPVVRDILDFREGDKLLSTFLWPHFDHFDRDGNIISFGYADENDRCHPTWLIHKITGRWASVDPVYSNWPKAKLKKIETTTGWVACDRCRVVVQLTDKGCGCGRTIILKGKAFKVVRPNLRQQVVARKGRRLVGFDFSQLEARLIALVSGDPFLMQVFREGRDLHYECAAVIFGKIFDQADEAIRKQLRENAKNFEYGAFYGGSPETLWKTLLQQGYKIELRDVVAAVGALLAKMPGIVQWQRRAVYQASHAPFQIASYLLNRRRTFPMGQVDPNEAINFGIQSSGADLMNSGMDRMADRLLEYKEAYPILQIHDAAVFEVWEDDADQIEADIQETFTCEYGGIPFPVEVKQAQSWDQL